MPKMSVWTDNLGALPVNLPRTNNYAATTNPSASNDGSTSQNYEVGSVWVNTSTKAIFECVANTAGAAVWVELAASGASVPDVSSAYNTSSSAVTFQATGANISGGSAFVVLDLTGNPAGSANCQLPTVANLVAALTNPVAGDSYNLRIKNTANSGTWTVTTASGWTLTGTMTIATGTLRDFVVTLNSLSAATIQNIGGFTFT